MCLTDRIPCLTDMTPSPKPSFKAPSRKDADAGDNERAGSDKVKDWTEMTFPDLLSMAANRTAWRRTSASSCALHLQVPATTAEIEGLSEWVWTNCRFLLLFFCCCCCCCCCCCVAVVVFVGVFWGVFFLGGGGEYKKYKNSNKNDC